MSSEPLVRVAEQMLELSPDAVSLCVARGVDRDDPGYVSLRVPPYPDPVGITSEWVLHTLAVALLDEDPASLDPYVVSSERSGDGRLASIELDIATILGSRDD